MEPAASLIRETQVHPLERVDYDRRVDGVATTSQAQDRGPNAALYAASGVGDTLALLAFPEVEVALGRILPP